MRIRRRSYANKVFFDVGDIIKTNPLTVWVRLNNGHHIKRYKRDVLTPLPIPVPVPITNEEIAPSVDITRTKSKSHLLWWVLFALGVGSILYMLRG